MNYFLELPHPNTPLTRLRDDSYHLDLF